jgi:hypothetical protein
LPGPGVSRLSKLEEFSCVARKIVAVCCETSKSSSVLVCTFMPNDDEISKQKIAIEIKIIVFEFILNKLN